MKLSEKLQNGLLAFSAKIEANKYLGSIKDAFDVCTFYYYWFIWKYVKYFSFGGLVV